MLDAANIRETIQYSLYFSYFLRDSKRNEHNYAMAIKNEASEPLQKPAPKKSSCTMETCESKEKKDNSLAITDNV